MALAVAPAPFAVVPWFVLRGRPHCFDAAFGQPDKALADFAKGVESEPKNLAVWTRRAEFYVAQGQWEKAVADFDKALELQPAKAGDCNNLAWHLATCPDPRVRKPDRAVQLAAKATQLAPKDGTNWNTLGVAQYRASQFKEAVTSLTKSMDLRSGGDAFDWFFLAMAHGRLKNKDEARRWYDKAVAWMEKNKPDDEELLRFRAEAAELLGIVKNEKKPPAGKAKTEGKG